MTAVICRRFTVTGDVQGVGYRFFAQVAAQRSGLVGSVRNLPDGSVEVLAQGSAEALEQLAVELRKGPPFSQVERLEFDDTTPDHTLTAFTLIR